jgi:hypothetical protein
MAHQTTQASGPNITVPFVSGVERYVEQYRARTAAGGIGGTGPPDRRRVLVLTAAFSPMIAVAALPVTAGVAVVAFFIGNVTARWVGLVVLVAAVLGLGYLTARWAARYDDMPATRGWRRWLPLTATVVVVGSCLAEIVSGSRAPDPVLVLWLASMVWVVAFLPLAAGVWGPARRALWAVGPAVTVASIVFVWTQGFFSLPFARAVAEFDALAQQVVSGDHVADGTHAGGFVVHDVNLGRLGRNAGCDVEFWITGWHEEDTRYIAHCVRHPNGDFTHLKGDWWELKDKTPPSDL